MMFRGEPTAYRLTLWGYLFYILTLTFGLSMPQVLDLGIDLVYQVHYLTAFFGFIGLILLGAQLQFFRAIAAVRKYEPAGLRLLYIIVLVGGISSAIIGSLILNKSLVTIGLFAYFIGTLIHSFWIWNASQSDLFKFPLNYLRGSHLFLLSGLILLLKQVLDNPLNLATDNFTIIHILGIGWISLSLQGAIIRILPMFGGQVIDRSFRQYIDYHFYFSFVSSVLFTLGFYLSSNPIFIIGLVFWAISWLWVIALIVSSNILSEKEIDYPFTFVMFVTGLSMMTLGVITGVDTQLFDNMLNLQRAVHIHSTLLAGLSLIMIGALHRINAFQTFTILYTGRRDAGYRLDDFLKMNQIKIIFIGMVVATLSVVLGFTVNSKTLIITGGVGHYILSILFGLHLMRNYIHYHREKDNAIPYWLKPSEYKAETDDS